MLKDAVLIMLLLTCTYTDLCKRIIYNRVLLPVAVFGLVYALLTAGLGGLGQSLAGLLLGLALLLLPFCLGGLGGGDVKLLAVIGALQGPHFTWRAFLASALVGGIWALIYLVRRGSLRVTLNNLCLKIYYLLRGMPAAVTIPKLDEVSFTETLPYGAALALGTLLTYLSW